MSDPIVIVSAARTPIGGLLGYSHVTHRGVVAAHTAISLPSLMAEDPEELHFRNKGFLIGGGGGTRVRQKFLPCAFWSACLRTDAEGRARATFTAPDSLTRYKILAVAHAGADRFGSAQSARKLNFNSFSAHSHGGCYRLLHCTAERYSSLKLLCDRLTNQLGIHFWTLNFKDIDLNILVGDLL